MRSSISKTHFFSKQMLLRCIVSIIYHSWFMQFFLLLFTVICSIHPLKKATVIYSYVTISLALSALVLQLNRKDANRLMTWETIQKEDFLSAQNKIQKSSDSERLKRMSVK